jgi:4'-phosphopantetheinyl transferase
MSLSPSALRPGVTHLFLAHPERILAAAPHHERWLSPPERARAARYRMPSGGTRYRATRVLVRGVLAGLLARPPGELEFVELAHGRPALRNGTATLDFNASRCPSWVALVVTAGPACGVDVEDVSREANFLGIARAFAPSERSLLEASSPEELRRRFFALWTLKEATLKALGTGLSLSLGACAFQLDKAKPPRVTFSGVITEEATEWSFCQLAADASHLVAVAVRSAPAPELVLHDDAETCAAVAALEA